MLHRERRVGARRDDSRTKSAKPALDAQIWPASKQRLRRLAAPQHDRPVDSRVNGKVRGKFEMRGARIVARRCHGERHEPIAEAGCNPLLDQHS